MSDCIYIYQSVSLSPSSSSSHSLLTCPSSLIPFYNKSSSVPSTALLKCNPSQFWWDALSCCYDPLTKLLVSSSWGHNMASSQEPLTIQLLSVVLNGFFTTTYSTCSCEVIPPGMTTRSVFMDVPVIVTLISGVTCPWNASKTGIPRPSVPHHQQPTLPPNFYIGIWQQVLYAAAPLALFCDSGSHVVETCYRLLTAAT